MPNCLSCGAAIDEYDSAYYSRNMLCIPCFSRKISEAQMVSCDKCGRRIRRDEARNRRGGVYCNYCFSELERLEQLPSCKLCTRKIEHWENSVKSIDGNAYHIACVEKAKDSRILLLCAYCNQPTYVFAFIEGFPICPRCYESYAKKPLEHPKQSPFLVAVKRVLSILG